jgi:hypothetical protein
MIPGDKPFLDNMAGIKANEVSAFEDQALVTPREWQLVGWDSHRPVKASNPPWKKACHVSMP